MLLSAAASGSGYLINAKVLSQLYVFTTYENQYWHAFEISSLIDVLSDFLRLFGYPYVEDWSSTAWDENYLFSACGILGAFGIVIMCAVIFSAVRLLMRWKELRFSQQTVVLTFWACLGIDGLVFSCLYDESSMNGSYWLPVVPLAIALLAIEISTEHFRTQMLRSVVTAALLFCILCSSASTSVRVLHTAPRTRPGLEQVGEWLIENGWLQGYSTFWSGNILTELTNGEIEVWLTYDVYSQITTQWLQSNSHDTSPQGRVFVLLSPQEGETLVDLPYRQDEYVIYSDGNGYVVLGFESAEQFYELIEAASQ